MLSQSEAQEAVGRVVIHISSINTLANSPDNVILENEDRLVIPTYPASVQVLGQVYTPNAIVYEPGTESAGLTCRELVVRLRAAIATTYTSSRPTAAS